MTKILLECAFCNTTIEREKSAYNRANRVGQKNNFCSRDCFFKYDRLVSSADSVCTLCSKEFRRYNREIKKVKNCFCSSSCAATYNNTHKTKGTRRSKLESYLEEQLSLLFPSLVVRFNNKDIINSELDIYIPQFKLAIELNGIYHSKPIYGEEKLKKIQDNDLLKKEACTKQLITLVTIDTSNQKKWNLKSSEEFLLSIKELISGYIA